MSQTYYQCLHPSLKKGNQEKVHSLGSQQMAQERVHLSLAAGYY